MAIEVPNALQSQRGIEKLPQTPPTPVVVHLSDHNRVMVAQVDYHIRAEQSINGKETTEYIHKVSMI